MSWSIEEHIGDNRPWPTQIVVYKGEMSESMAYVSGEVADRLKDENAKLRELVSDMFEEIEAGGFDPIVERHGKNTIYYEEDPSWRVRIRERVRELGIEVEE